MTKTKTQTVRKRYWWLELLGILIVVISLHLFEIGSPAEKIIIMLLGLIYWKI